MGFCPKCDSKVLDDSAVCTSCGAQLSNRQAPTRPGRRNILLITLCITATVLAIAVIFFVIAPVGHQSAFSDDPAAITAASRSVVLLNCYDAYDRLLSTGSGFAFFEEGVIVTNFHVIDGDVYSIQASTEDNITFGISAVLAYDEDADIAILQTHLTTKLTPLQPGDSRKLQKGEKVVAIGSPLGLMNSVSTGVFSGYITERNMDILQFSAPISSGSSGGALFNDNGQVLGITFASYGDGQNLNLAIPIEAVTALWNDRPAPMTIDEFYAARLHVYSVDHVIANAPEMGSDAFYMEGWVLSHNVHSESTYTIAGAWCTLYAATEEFPAVRDSGNTALDVQIPGYEAKCVMVQTYSPDLLEAFSNLRTGDHIRVKVTINRDDTTHLLTLTAEEIVPLE